PLRSAASASPLFASLPLHDALPISDRTAFALPDQPITAEDRRIAAHVESLIDDGATLQTGIGGIPNAVAQLLAAGNKGDFGIHTDRKSTRLNSSHVKSSYAGFCLNK